MKKMCERHIFFSAKILAFMLIFNDQSFKDTLTNDIVSFEQMGPEIMNCATTVKNSEALYGTYKVITPALVKMNRCYIFIVMAFGANCILDPTFYMTRDIQSIMSKFHTSYTIILI